MSPGVDYQKHLVRRLWDFAESELMRGESPLETSQRNSTRPPVFRKDKARHNILFPPGATDDLRAAIEATIPKKERHRWFRSMKSSQAVAQSVFGNLIVSGKLGLLQNLESDEALPAFCECLDEANVQMEYSVSHLGEPRPTSVDFWIDGSSRVAVECKLTEADFGTCSRPRLREGKDSNYLRDHCDGIFSRQRGRRSRCSLTEIGVKYWDHIPALFEWVSEEDLAPCPLRNTYQVVRNVLAACVPPDGRIDSDNAHALIIYDARNPSFQAGGVANEQWRAAKAALKNPALLRSCSWQSLVSHLATTGEVNWLVSGLEKKYGF